MTETVIAVVFLVIGVGVGRYLLGYVYKKWEKEAKEKAGSILREAEANAESLKKQKMLDSKEQYFKLKTEFEQETNRKRNQLHAAQNKLKQQESRFKQNETKLKQKEGLVAKQQEQLKKRTTQLDSLETQIEAHKDVIEKQIDKAKAVVEKQVVQLEKISGMRAEDAREQLIKTLRDEAETKASAMVKELMEEAMLSAKKDAKKLIINTIQRTAAEHAIENCITTFNLDSDEIKGKIIGREGRNIRALEASTGVEIIVDDTPGAINISGFDPVRREIARMSLQKLVIDGRIHPARIEEVVQKTQKNVEDQITEIGERTVIDLGIHGLKPELIKMVGRMRFRSSYGQNLLQHSREVARLCATLAAELGLNVKLAKRAGLLHDIGKVPQEHSDESHAILGMKLAQKYGEVPQVCNAIGAHHDEIEMTAMISPLVQACDAISGSRPGVRREMTESYIKRLHELEALALSFKGVNKCFAMQAGRELRILVDAENVSDSQASQISFDISQKIEKEMQYPGQIKVTVIREMRTTNYAR